MKLTIKAIAALSLPPGKAERIVFDDDVPGFGLRFRAAGARTWVFQYKLGTKQRRLSFGAFPAISPEVARQTARDLYARVRLGHDPAGEKLEHRARAAETMSVILPAYLAHAKARLRPRSFVETTRHLVVHGKPLHGLRLTAIDRRTIATMLTAIAAASGPIAANRVRASLSAFFRGRCAKACSTKTPSAEPPKNPSAAATASCRTA